MSVCISHMDTDAPSPAITCRIACYLSHINKPVNNAAIL